MGDPPAARPRLISAIMPAYNAARFLERSLPPLLDAQRDGRIVELIVVDDTSSDDSAALAARLGARVVPSGGRLGPAGARNVAANIAIGDILWFVDADVMIAADAADHVAEAFLSDGVWAVFGSYDAAPAERHFGSQYKNLLHHHHHQQGAANAETFWAGCGAVRRGRFLQLGGFKAEEYPKPSIEDVDLGYRIRDAGGEIRLDRELLSKHLKRWRIGEIIRVDIFQRALPWSRLMLRRGAVDNVLNVSWPERLRAVLAGLLVISIAAAAATLLPFWAPMLVASATLPANAALFSTFALARGPAFAVAAILFHQVYYLYSSAAFVWCWCERRFTRP